MTGNFDNSIEDFEDLHFNFIQALLDRSSYSECISYYREILLAAIDITRPGRPFSEKDEDFFIGVLELVSVFPTENSPAWIHRWQNIGLVFMPVLLILLQREELVNRGIATDFLRDLEKEWKNIPVSFQNLLLLACESMLKRGIPAVDYPNDGGLFRLWLACADPSRIDAEMRKLQNHSDYPSSFVAIAMTIAHIYVDRPSLRDIPSLKPYFDWLKDK